MLNKSKKNIIERSRKFWTKEKTDRPMIGMLYNRLAPLSTFSQEYSINKSILPKDISENIFLKDC